jgi:hypothetical protein
MAVEQQQGRTTTAVPRAYRHLADVYHLQLEPLKHRARSFSRPP